MLEFWNQLVNTALLGTDKKDFSTDDLPESIRQVVATDATLPKENLLLQTAALSQQYLTAGLGAESMVLPDITVCEKEVRPYANRQASLILQKLLEEDDKNPFLIEHWLEKCQEKGWVVSPDFLVTLLDLGSEKKYAFLHPAIRQVVGKRGEWLARFNSDWSYLPEKDPETVWLEGKMADRQEVLLTIRMREPQRARELLEKSWEQESARDKVTFLNLLQHGLNSDDEPFLKGVWKHLCHSKEGSKPVNQEIKATAARLLLSLPGSELSLWVGEKLQIYFPKKKKSVSSKQTTEVSLVLPKKEDDFFSEDWMHQQMGFDQLSPDVNKFVDAEYWLSELIRFLHPSYWEHLLEVSPEEVIKTFAENPSFLKKESKSKTPLFIHSLAEAIHRHKDQDWASAFLQYFKKADFISLCSLLPQPALEEYFRNHVDLSAPGKNRECLVSKQLSEWSLPFTRHVITMLAKSVEKYFYSKENQQFIKTMALFVHPDIVSELDKLLEEKNQEWLKQQLRETLISPIVQMLATRQEIKEAF